MDVVVSALTAAENEELGLIEESRMQHGIRLARNQTQIHATIVRLVSRLSQQIAAMSREVGVGTRITPNHLAFSRPLRRCLKLVEYSARVLPRVYYAHPARKKRRRTAGKKAQKPNSQNKESATPPHYNAWDFVRTIDPTKLDVLRGKILNIETSKHCLELVGYHLGDILDEGEKIAREYDQLRSPLTSQELADIEVSMEHLQSHALLLLPALALLNDPQTWDPSRFEPRL